MKGQPFKRIAGVLKQVAPTLLAGVAGPAGPLVAAIAKKALGDESMPDDKLEEAVAAATGTSEGLAKLRQIEVDLKKTDLDFATLEVEDRKDSRQLAAGRSLMPWLLLTMLFVGGYFAILSFVLHRVFFSPPDSMPDVALLTIASTLLGVLTGEVPRIMSWWFGSSQGSSTKTDVLAEAVRNK